MHKEPVGGRIDHFEQAIQDIQARDDWSDEYKAEMIAEARRWQAELPAISMPTAAQAILIGKERARLKSQSKDDAPKATETDPMEPVLLENGGRRYGTKALAILFKPDGSVSLMRGSQSLKANWKSVAGRIGAIAEYTEEEKRLGNTSRAELDPVVFELAAINLPNTRGALFEILSETQKHTFERKRDKLMRQINSAWAIRHKEARLHQKFLVELRKLAQKLGHPPTKGELARELGLSNNAPRMSQLCKELCCDWLRNAKRGPKPSKWKRKKSS
jgi:hypothetical protein